MPRFVHRPNGSAVYSDDEDALEYLVVGKNDENLAQLRDVPMPWHIIYDAVIGDGVARIPWEEVDDDTIAYFCGHL